HADVALRIGIDQQRVVLSLGEAGGQVDRGRRLSGAALLVEDRDPTRAFGAEAVLAEPGLAAVQRAKMTLLAIRGYRDLKHEGRPKHLAARAARLLHALIEAAWVNWGQLFSRVLLECARGRRRYCS